MDLYKLKREFLEHCELEKGQSLLTVNSYDRHLERFFEFLKTNVANESEKNKEEKPVEFGPQLITQELARVYRLHINRLKGRDGRELKKSTQNYHMLALRAFLRYLAWRGIPTLSPEKIPISKTGDREIHFLESEEVKNIINMPSDDSAMGLRDRAILDTLFSTGLRVSELVGLNIDTISLERGEIAVLGKGKKMRVVFLSDGARDLIYQYLVSRGYGDKLGKLEAQIPLFISNRGSRLTVRSIERLVKKYANLAGISKKVSPHTLRHSFATDLLIAGADIRSVQSMLGHSSISTTQVYTHITDQHLHEIHQKFHGKALDGENLELKDQNSKPEPDS